MKLDLGKQKIITLNNVEMNAANGGGKRRSNRLRADGGDCNYSKTHPHVQNMQGACGDARFNAA